MRAVEMWGEFNAARAAMRSSHREKLVSFGVDAADVEMLAGITRARVHAGLWAPEEDGGAGVVTPVLVHDPLGPESPCPHSAVRFGEIVDLLLWHPNRPDEWALRVGAAEWLGAIEPQYLAPGAVPIRRSPLSWFASGGTGIVLLSRSPADRYRVLAGCTGGIIAEDDGHAVELRRILARPFPMPRVLVARPEGVRDAA